MYACCLCIINFIVATETRRQCLTSQLLHIFTRHPKRTDFLFASSFKLLSWRKFLFCITNILQPLPSASVHNLSCLLLLPRCIVSISNCSGSRRLQMRKRIDSVPYRLTTCCGWIQSQFIYLLDCKHPRTVQRNRRYRVCIVKHFFFTYVFLYLS